MPRPALSRFHVALALAILFIVASLAMRQPFIAAAALPALIIVSGFGVAIPRMRWFGPFICHGSRDARCIALTFDDGPDPRSTPALLDLLRDAGVKATFFCIGRHVDAHPDLAARIVREGHTLGNHSYSHSNATNFFGTDKVKDELAHAQSAIAKAAGITPQFFRPPMGLSNPRVFAAARSMNLRVIGWSARGYDTQTSDFEKIVARIVRDVAPGAIILLHDGGIDAPRLVVTVKSLLEKLRCLQYEIVPLEQLLK